MSAVGILPRTVDGLHSLAPALNELASDRVLVVCGPSRRFVDRVQAVLEARQTAVCDIARVHVPRSVVDEALQCVEQFKPDTVVSVGGGAATGLAKALRLHHELTFVAMPTTYSGSEHTALYGISDAGSKQTGVDARVLPDVICLVPEFSASMNLRQSVTSLLNALAHPISALWGSVLDQAAAEVALAAAQEMSSVIAEMLQTPDAAGNRRRALIAAGACARCLQDGKLGPHHRWAHALGGRYQLEHGLLHSILLPHSVRVLRVERPMLAEQLREAFQTSDLAGLCFDYLAQSGAETALLPLLESAQVTDTSDAPESTLDFARWRERLTAVGIPDLVLDDLLLGQRPSAAG